MGGQGGCERRIEVFCENSEIFFFFFFFFLGGGSGGGGVGGRGRVWGGGVRMDVIEELKFWGKFTKKKLGVGAGLGRGGGRVGGGGGGGSG